MTARITVVALTAAGSVEARHAVDRGCAAVVAKPFDLDALLAAVKRLTG